MKTYLPFIFLLLLQTTNLFAINLIATTDKLKGFAVECKGDYAYVANYEDGLDVFDLRILSSPKKIKTYNSLACDLKIVDTIAYVLTEDGLEILSVSNSANPQLLGTYPFIGDAPWSIYVEDEFAYFDNGWGQITKVDCSNLSSPKHVWTTNRNTNTTYDLAVRQSYIFQCGDGLRINRQTNSTYYPLEAGYTVFPSKKVEAIELAGDSAYVAVDSFVEILNISNPAAVQNVGSIRMRGVAKHLVANDDFLYVVVEGYGLQVLDRKNALGLIEAGWFSTPNNTYRICISQNFACMVGYDSQMDVLENIKDYSANHIASFAMSGSARGVKVSGGYAYVAIANTGFHMVDVNNLLEPKLVSTYTTTGNVNSLVINDDYVILAKKDFGLSFLHIGTQTNPQFTEIYTVLAKAKYIAKQNNYAYVDEGVGKLRIIDITVRTPPLVVGTLDISSNVNSLTVAASKVYIAGLSGGLNIIDVTMPSSPSVIGAFNVLKDVRHVAVSGNYAYVANGATGVFVLDVSTPSLIKVVDSFNTFGIANYVLINDNKLFVSDGLSEIPVFDISNPATLKHLGHYNTLGQSYSLFEENGYLFSADGKFGMSIINLNEEPNSIEKKVENNNNSGHYFKTYPDPFKSAVNIVFKLDNSVPVDVMIYDIRGKKVAKFLNVKTNHIVWNAADFVSGCYIAKTHHGGKIYSRKMMLID